MASLQLTHGQGGSAPFISIKRLLYIAKYLLPNPVGCERRIIKLTDFTNRGKSRRWIAKKVCLCPDPASRKGFSEAIGALDHWGHVGQLHADCLHPKVEQELLEPQQHLDVVAMPRHHVCAGTP